MIYLWPVGPTSVPLFCMTLLSAYTIVSQSHYIRAYTYILIITWQITILIARNVWLLAARLCNYTSYNIYVNLGLSEVLIYMMIEFFYVYT